METIYVNAHAAIRADPSQKPKEPKDKSEEDIVEAKEPGRKRWGKRKLTLDERKKRIAKAKEDFLLQLKKDQATA